MAAIAPIFNDTNYMGITGNQGTNEKKELGRSDFLNLLVTQLRNQDPLNPMKNHEFIAQLASFSSLEQMTNLNKNMEKFLKNQQYQSTVAALNMIGKEVTTTKGEGGVVSSVKMVHDGVYLMVNDKKIAFSEIKEIK